MRTILSMMASAAALATGCSAGVQPPGDASGDQAGDAVVDASQGDASDVTTVCGSNADCVPGQICFYTGNCTRPGICGPGVGVPCSLDRVPFCGCDGQTFTASSVCPDHPYSRLGACAPSDGGFPPVD